MFLLGEMDRQEVWIPADYYEEESSGVWDAGGKAAAAVCK